VGIEREALKKTSIISFHHISKKSAQNCITLQSAQNCINEFEFRFNGKGFKSNVIFDEVLLRGLGR
jgi:hypothetical protein